MIFYGIQEDKYWLEFLIKYTLPYLLWLLLPAIWLFSRSIAI